MEELMNEKRKRKMKNEKKTKKVLSNLRILSGAKKNSIHQNVSDLKRYPSCQDIF